MKHEMNKSQNIAEHRQWIPAKTDGQILRTILIALMLLYMSQALVHGQSKTAHSWGRNSSGELGDGTTTGRRSPAQIGTATNWISVVCGDSRTLAIKSDGTLWAWGRNDYGQLGDGTTIQRNSPVHIGSATNWASVSCGVYHTLAIKTDGTLWAWGRNLYGQLGDGTTIDQHSPIQIDNATDWASVSCGFIHTLAIKTDGTLWAWGRNHYGQLGDGTIDQRNTPVLIGSAKSWASIACGSIYSIAIRTDGTLWAWGYNGSGQLGDGTTYQRNTPVQIGSATNWTSVSCGSSHTLAIKTNRTLWAWGSNSYGQLGNGTTGYQLSPVQIGNATNWASVKGGGFHTLGINTEGYLWAWGYNSDGQIGDGTTTQRNTPVQIGTATNWALISAGVNHSLALATAPANQPPVAVCQNAIVYVGSNCTAVVNPENVDNGSYDPDDDPLTYSLTPSGTYSLGTYTVTLTVTDNKNASSTCTAIVTVVDNTSPNVITQNITATLDGSGNASVIAAQVDNGSNDNCGIAFMSVSPNSFTCSDIGTNTVTLTVRDVSGNNNSATAMVTVVDNTPPTVITQNISTTLDGSGNVTVSAAQVNNGSTDNCGIALMSVSPSNFTCINIGSNVVTLTVTDVNGNSSSAAASVTVIGAIPTPSITASPFIPVNPGGDENTIYVNYGPQNVTLNATGGSSYSWTPATGLSCTNCASPTAAPTETTTYTVTVTNQYGCTAQSSITLTVVDLQCGTNPRKFLVCHRCQHAQLICIDESAVQTHLNHGDYLGACHEPPAKIVQDAAISSALFLSQNYPNPFNPSTTISYGIPKDGHVLLRVFDVHGRVVMDLVNEYKAMGNYSVDFDGSKLPSGIYLYRLEAAGQVKTATMTLVK